MLSDIRLLLWLRVRHARTAFVRLFYVFGTDVELDRDFGERGYQLYAVALAVVWIVSMWAALLDATADAFALVGAEGCASALLVALLAIVAVFVGMALQYVRTSALKLRRPDIPFVAASPVSTCVLVAMGWASSVLAGGGIAAALGYVLGVGLQSGLGTFVAPTFCALVAALLAMAAMGGAWVVGIVRLAFGSRGRRAFVVGALVAATIGAAVLCLALALAATPAAFMAGGGMLASVGAAVVVLGEAVVLRVLAPRIDMTAVITENALYADLQPFGLMSPLDHATLNDYRRRRKLASRLTKGVHFRLRSVNGPGALVARAVLSHMRQWGGLGNIVVFGAMTAPLGVVALSGAGGLVLFLFWLAALVMVPQGVREITRAFRDDMRVRLVRDRLPFTALTMLVLDALPGFVLACVVSCATVVLAQTALLPAGFSLAAALVLCVLINAVAVLSCGLDAVRLYPGGPRLCYEMGAVALVLVTGVLSFAGVPLLTLVGGIAVCAAVVFIVRGGAESDS